MARQEERPVTVALPEHEAQGLALEALYIAGRDGDRRGAVLAPPHPLYGGSMESPVLNELAWGCTRAGVASLRFNWRGVGASAGDPSGAPEVADRDFSAALAHMAETVRGELVAGGYSFGAASALRAAAGRPRVGRLVLVAPPPALLQPDAFERFGGPILVLVGERDALADPVALARLVEGRPGVRLEHIPEADHFFSAGLAELSRHTAQWLGGRS